MPELASTDPTAEQLELLRSAMHSGTMLQAKRILNGLHPAEIADLLESLPRSQRLIIWGMVDHENDGEILVEVGEEVRGTLVREMETEELVDALEGLDTDDMADLLQSLPEAVIQETLGNMKKQDRERVEAVLSYEEGTAGALMNTNTITIRPNVTLEVVQRYMRKLGELPVGTDRLYVVDYFNKFLGVLYLRTLVTSDASQTVSEVMEHNLTPVTAERDEHDIARLFEDRDLLSIPVIDEQEHLLGQITVDDVVDVIREEADKHMMNRAGLSEEEDIFAPVFKSTRRRSVWLGANLLTAFLASWVIGLFAATIDQVVALAVLMPIVASMGGIAGSQTLTLVIRAQALGQLGSGNTRPLLLKELAVGMLNGLLWAGVVAAIAAFWFNSLSIGGIIGAALIINLTAAALAGVSVPVILRKMNIDAALAGGVVLTTVTDVIGFMAFLGIATLVLV
ncbi:MAG: magnesium transporter [Gammaproteobacteria bacterium]|nr:MAG: magnesium transporter [Gammaproteobacteria bacterium]